MKLVGAKVLVTGGTGFLGRHVGQALRAAGAEPLLVGRSDGDLCGANEVGALLRATTPDTVIHLAAVVGGIGANRAEPARYFHDNMLMGLNVIEGCRRAGVSKTLVVGTACSYPGDAPVPTREEHLWLGYPEPTNAPYGIAKRALLVQLQAYRQQYGCDMVAVVPTNLYGPGDNFDLASGHVIPNLLRRFSEAAARGEERVVLWGDGTPTRDFLHVADAARGCVRALADYDDATPLNLSSDVEVSIATLATMIATLTDYTGAIEWDTSMPNGQQRRRLDASRAWNALGWRATVPLESGLAETWAWYRGSLAVQ